MVLGSDDEAESARNEISSEVSEVSNGATTRMKASKKLNDNNRSNAKSIRREDNDVGGVLESSPNLSTGLSNILQDDPQREKTDNEVIPEVENSAGEEIASEGARSKISEANTRSASDNGGVPESTEVSEVSKCASYKKNDEDKEVVPEVENSAGEESDSEGARSKISDANTRSASDIGEIDEGNYIDYSCKYYSFNII